MDIGTRILIFFFRGFCFFRIFYFFGRDRRRRFGSSERAGSSIICFVFTLYLFGVVFAVRFWARVFKRNKVLVIWNKVER